MTLYIPEEKRRRIDKLNEFVEWAGTHIKGDERAEAQSFLNRFFQCFGYDGVLEAGGRFEVPVKGASLLENKGFFDCLFEDVVLIEMKSIDKSLSKYYPQLRQYWMQSIPKPKYAILCNFKEFWIYDFNTQMEEPVQKIDLVDLPKHPEKWVFMEKGKASQTIEWDLNLEKITKKTVEDLYAFYDSLVKQNEPKQKRGEGLSTEELQHFVLQCMLCMFAEDIGLMPPHFFTDLVGNCLDKPTQSYDYMKALFDQMDSETPARGGNYKDIPYFNGGLFAKRIPIELNEEQVRWLHLLAKQDWRPVRPSIFGTIFERMICQGKRHAGGVHYTSEADIMQILQPTVIQYWQEKIMLVQDETPPTEQSHAYKALLDEIRAYRILDPACGSGNFLYMAFIELKRLEKALIEAYTASTPTPEEAYSHSSVSSKQFFGLDVNHFAVELAKLTLEIGRKKAVDELHLDENVLPLNNLQDNLICADALFSDWPEADAIIGNPPFLGSRHFRKEGFTDDYIDKMHALYPDKEFPNSADLCAYWFRKAQDHSATRCGLVSSNSIAQGVSRQAGLEYILNHGGIIHNALSSQIWSGEANVHVSLVNWCKNDNPTHCILNHQPVEKISSSLTIEESEITKSFRLKQNLNICFQGVIPNGQGFIIESNLAKKYIAEDLKYEKVIKPFVTGDPLTDHYDLKPKRWIIDFAEMPIEEASTYPVVFKHLQKTVKDSRNKIKEENDNSKVEKNAQLHWWKLARPRPAMRKALHGLKSFIAIPSTSKWTMALFISVDNLIGHSCYAVASDDFYVLGILNSRLHLDWVKAQASTLKADTRYTNTTCFETFPFLWDAPETVKNKIRPLAQALDEFRLNYMLEHKIGITTLYNQFFHEETSQLFKLHAKLDKAVCESVYGWDYDASKNYNEDLFHLNQKLASAE
ncbi:MAG: DNA methyltransferase [Vampirovibrionales bacterium]